jgi:predicted HTH domain antitoxin
MKTITLEIPDSVLDLGWCTPEDFPAQLRLATAIFWYDRGLISPGKGAEIAGLSHAEFIGALGRAKVSAIQTSAAELKAEVEQALNARR